MNHMSRFKGFGMGPSLKGPNPSAPYNPASQSDEAIRGFRQAGNDQNNVPFDVVVKNLDNANIPPQLREVPWLISLVSNNTPILLIPNNLNRMSYIIAAPEGVDIYFSYGWPLSFAGAPIGIFLPAGSFYQEGNGTISIDDIYVWTTEYEDIDIGVLGYEGTLAVESNLQKNTQNVTG